MSKPSFYLSADEIAILESTATRLGISRSEVARHLILYHGMTGGGFPLTTRILSLPPADRRRVIAGIRRRVESEAAEATAAEVAEAMAGAGKGTKRNGTTTAPASMSANEGKLAKERKPAKGSDASTAHDGTAGSFRTWVKETLAHHDPTAPAGDGLDALLQRLMEE